MSTWEKVLHVSHVLRKELRETESVAATEVKHLDRSDKRRFVIGIYAMFFSGFSFRRGNKECLILLH